jgi:cell division protease FtsH
VNRFFRSALFPLIVIVLLVYLASQTFMGGDDNRDDPTYSEFVGQVEDEPQRFQNITFDPDKRSIKADLKEGQGDDYSVNYPSDEAGLRLQQTLEENNISFDSKGTGGFSIASLLISLLPFLLLIGFWIFLMNQVQGGGSKVMSFGKSRAKRMTPDSPKIGFKDVAGVDEAVEELHEIKEFLENPKKFQALGARIPKGVLLYGPPGTGKTLLARAVAGEAGVPFFSISGSDFVEMFVGVGASRVRDLFEQAKQSSPCIVFMDEIDAVGRHRGAGLGGGHDEREQTLNQLLVEMDGFELKDNIILIAATNRPDILDPALLRPGRFDRQIVVDRPDRVGRRKILEVHAKGKPLAQEIELDTLAAGTPGFTGADLANLVNEAALLAARRGKKTIGQEELEEGIMRVIAGPEKKTRIFTEEEKKITAYHELGHAIVGHYLNQETEVHKISIVGRGQALGYTISLPREDRYLTTRSRLMAELASILGGRAAEEAVFHEVTTGAANDLEKVTHIAKQMIMRYGMSEKLGPRVLGRNTDMPFLGREMSAEPDYSEEIAREIDDEIHRVIEEAHKLAHQVLEEHSQELHRISAILIERETIDKDQFERLLAGEDEESVFPSEAPEAAPGDEKDREKERRRLPRGPSRFRGRQCSLRRRSLPPSSPRASRERPPPRRPTWPRRRRRGRAARRACRARPAARSRAPRFGRRARPSSGGARW